jgi:hypothetical protein
MRLLVLVFSLLLAAPLHAQDKAPKKKSAAKKQAAHKKPTPEQVKKFNQLQKQKQREAKG